MNIKKFITLFLALVILTGSGSLLVLRPAESASWLDEAFNDNLKQFAEEGAGYKPVADGEESIYGLVGNIIQTFLSLLGVIFLCLIVYGGFMWMTARGEETKVDSAKAIIRNATIGLGIVIAAYAVSYFVMSKLTPGLIGGSSTSSLVDWSKYLIYG